MTDYPKVCTKNYSYVPQLRCKFQVSTFSRFKVIAFFIFVYEFVKYAGKNIKTSDAKRRGSPKNILQHKFKLKFEPKTKQIEINASTKTKYDLQHTTRLSH